MLAGQEAPLKARSLSLSAPIYPENKTEEEDPGKAHTPSLCSSHRGRQGRAERGHGLQSASMSAWTCWARSCSLGCNLTHDVTVSHLH